MIASERVRFGFEVGRSDRSLGRFARRLPGTGRIAVEGAQDFSNRSGDGWRLGPANKAFVRLILQESAGSRLVLRVPWLVEARLHDGCRATPAALEISRDATGSPLTGRGNAGRRRSEHKGENCVCARAPSAVRKATHKQR